jgi:hypothetical protein
MQKEGYTVQRADKDGWEKPLIVNNTKGIGDKDNKQPDIDAYDENTGVIIIGEAKTGDGDLETLHTETQFRLFSNLQNSKNKKACILCIAVPKSKSQDLDYVLTKLGLKGSSNVNVLHYA